ncbi:MAG: peptidoglycan DD-metalloendopeptidase family protein [Pseudomonadota bacterium]|nr:peptidoglycan DD-metalloendopeptidase family protein [Pseudomonadota bacterium]
MGDGRAAGRADRLAAAGRIARGICLIAGPVILVLFIAACSGNPPKGATSGTYTVRKGDTLYAIARRYQVNYKHLAGWNGIRPPYTIYRGQKLRLSPSKSGKSSKSASRKSSTTGTRTASRKPDTSREPPINWHWPASGQVVSRYSATGTNKKGIDIAGAQGRPVSAASSGKVVYSGSGLLGYGKLIIIKHNEIYLSAYAHNRKLLVRDGTQVTGGQKIAEMGSTGTNSPKLHFEIRRYGKPVDPLQYLPRRGR